MSSPLELFETLIAGKKRSAAKGDVLFQQGDPITTIYGIVQGRVALTRCSVDGNPITVQLAMQGEMLAEASLFATYYHCMAQVESRTVELRCFDRDALIAALGASSDASMVLLKLFASQIRKQRGLLETRNIRAAKERIYTYFLLNADEHRQVRVPFTLKDMAYQLGLAHETLYREIKILEDEGRVIREDGVIKLC